MIEASFGEALEWEPLQARIGCGGWGSSESDRPEIQDWLAEKAGLLDQALRGQIQRLAL